MFLDEIAGALHNRHGAVMIGEVISLVDQHGVGWSFCSCEMYEHFIADPASFEGIEDDCVDVMKTEYQGSGMTCWNHWKNCYWEYIGSDKKVQQNLSFYYGPPSSVGWTTAEVQLVAWKHRWGKWRERRMFVKVRVFGQWRNDNCAIVDHPINREKGFRYQRRIHQYRGLGTERTFTDNDIHGQYWFNGSTTTRTLYKQYNGCN